MTTPQITALPDPPSRQDPSTFADKADAFLGALPDFATETNAVATFCGTKAAESLVSANTATTQAGIATTQASNALTSANNASNSEQLAEDWANKTTGAVDGSEYSAKYYAQLAGQSVESYQGALVSDPVLNKEGNPLVAGDWYVNTTSGFIRAYNGSTWVQGISTVSGVTSINGETGDVVLKKVFLQGNSTILAGSTSAYTITNYDSFISYTVDISAGTVTIAEDTIYVSAPSTEQTITLSISAEGFTDNYTIQVFEHIVDYGTDIDGLDSLVTIQQEYDPSTTYALNDVVVVRKSNHRFIEYKSLQANNTGNSPESSPSFWQLVYDNNANTSGYLGEVLGNKCVVDKGEWLSTTAYSIGDMVVVRNMPTPLKQSDLTAYVAKTANTNKHPASNPTDWEQRNALPTGTSLAQTLGIGNTTPEVLINNDSGWLKFVHQGKIKYIAKKPFMNFVSWDNIAKAEAVYGNRTIRIGSRLYRVSLLSGAEADPSSWTTSSTATDNKGAGSEWNELIYRVHTDVPTDGPITSHGGKQVGSNWWNFTDADLVLVSGDGRATWCKETYALNANARIWRGGSAGLTNLGQAFSNISNSGYGWRPCLTLISEPEADPNLYNAEATGVGPSVASLQYDPITDTGYYGEVSSAQFYTGTQISTATAVTSGTLQNDNEGWLKFYWHGQVLFIAKKTYRYSVSWDALNTANAIYGVNLGSTGKKTITHSGSSTQYDVKLIKGATKDPAPASGGGGQWNELIYRVCTGTETGEIGDNWAEFNPITDLGINSGNGSLTWCQEVYQPDTANRVSRGFASLSDFIYSASSSTAPPNGWRPCLSYVRS